MATFTLEGSDGFESLASAFEEKSELVGPAIDEVLHDSAAVAIKEHIDAFIPVSGRRWRGKAAPARGANWQSVRKAPMEVTVATSRRYQYLYFPDDGSNTRRHRGNKQMFKRGLDAAVPVVIEKIQSTLEDVLGEE